jgi:precorrin-6y C5,15-methyltransferase (decarboxylating) CbiE subunit
MVIDRIDIVGCGPGALEQVTPEALCAIDGAEVLVGAERLLDLFPNSQAERISVGADIAKALDEIAARLGKRKIAVLVTGDPGLRSLARPVIRRFGRDACRVIPGISSVQAAFASIGVDWYGARILSAHDRVPEADPAVLVHEEKLAVLAGNSESAQWLDGLAIQMGATHAIFVCENLTLSNEHVRRVDDLKIMTLASRTIILFIRKGDAL